MLKKIKKEVNKIINTPYSVIKPGKKDPVQYPGARPWLEDKITMAIYRYTCENHPLAIFDFHTGSNKTIGAVLTCEVLENLYGLHGKAMMASRTNVNEEHREDLEHWQSGGHPGIKPGWSVFSLRQAYHDILKFEENNKDLNELDDERVQRLNTYLNTEMLVIDEPTQGMTNPDTVMQKIFFSFMREQGHLKYVIFTDATAEMLEGPLVSFGISPENKGDYTIYRSEAEGFAEGYIENYENQHWEVSTDIKIDNGKVEHHIQGKTVGETVYEYRKIMDNILASDPDPQLEDFMYSLKQSAQIFQNAKNEQIVDRLILNGWHRLDRITTIYTGWINDADALAGELRTRLEKIGSDAEVVVYHGNSEETTGQSIGEFNKKLNDNKKIKFLILARMLTRGVSIPRLGPIGNTCLNPKHRSSIANHVHIKGRGTGRDHDPRIVFTVSDPLVAEAFGNKSLEEGSDELIIDELKKQIRDWDIISDAVKQRYIDAKRAYCYKTLVEKILDDRNSKDPDSEKREIDPGQILTPEELFKKLMEKDEWHHDDASPEELEELERIKELAKNNKGIVGVSGWFYVSEIDTTVNSVKKYSANDFMIDRPTLPDPMDYLADYIAKVKAETKEVENV